MRVGSKVVCIDDKFESWVNDFYVSLPKKDSIYIVRSVVLGITFDLKEGEVAITLKDLHNPKSNKSPFNERAFNSERFRELEPPAELEKKEDIEGHGVEKKELVEV